MRKVLVLGNCLSERLSMLLGPVLADRNREKGAGQQWELVRVPPVYNLPYAGFTLEKVAATAGQCDVVFTQPLFNFGVLNTHELGKIAAIRLHTFSAPNFAAYFPDIVHPKKFAAQEKFPPPLEWHSRIFLEFKASGINAAEVERCYLAHPLFGPRNMARVLEKSWDIYQGRDKDVEIGTLEIARRYFDSEILFYTWKHPADRIIRHILAEILFRLDFTRTEVENALRRVPFQEKSGQPDVWSYWGFGFNAWPVISRNNLYFKFPGREFFRIAGQRQDIKTAALLWFHYYEQHPDIYAALLGQVFGSA